MRNKIFALILSLVFAVTPAYASNLPSAEDAIVSSEENMQTLDEEKVIHAAAMSLDENGVSHVGGPIGFPHSVCEHEYKIYKVIPVGKQKIKLHVDRVGTNHIYWWGYDVHDECMSEDIVLSITKPESIWARVYKTKLSLDKLVRYDDYAFIFSSPFMKLSKTSVSAKHKDAYSKRRFAIKVNFAKGDKVVAGPVVTNKRIASANFFPSKDGNGGWITGCVKYNAPISKGKKNASTTVSIRLKSGLVKKFNVIACR